MGFFLFCLVSEWFLPVCFHRRFSRCCVNTSPPWCRSERRVVISKAFISEIAPILWCPWEGLKFCRRFSRWCKCKSPSAVGVSRDAAHWSAFLVACNILAWMSPSPSNTFSIKYEDLLLLCQENRLLSVRHRMTQVFSTAWHCSQNVKA